MVADFIQRVGAYPVVSSAFGQAAVYYAWAKDRSHPGIRGAVEATETGVMRVAGTAQPLLSRFEARLATLDQLACQQLDRLESRCPVINEPTETVVNKTQQYYCDSVKPKVELVLSPVTAAVNTVHTAGSYGAKQYQRLVGSSYGQAGLSRLDAALEAADKYVDNYLPEVTKEAEEEEDAKMQNGDVKEKEAMPAASARRALRLGRKLRRRLRTRVTRPVEELRTEFWSTVELIEAANANNEEEEVEEVKENEETSMEYARQCLHRAQVLSAAGWQVTAERVQRLELPATLRWGANGLTQLVARINFAEFLLDAISDRSRSGSSRDAASQADDPEPLEPTAESSICYDEPDDLETTDDTAADSDPSLNETN